MLGLNGIEQVLGLNSGEQVPGLNSSEQVLGLNGIKQVPGLNEHRTGVVAVVRLQSGGSIPSRSGSGTTCRPRLASGLTGSSVSERSAGPKGPERIDVRLRNQDKQPPKRLFSERPERFLLSLASVDFARRGRLQ